MVSAGGSGIGGRHGSFGGDSSYNSAMGDSSAYYGDTTPSENADLSSPKSGSTSADAANEDANINLSLSVAQIEHAVKLLDGCKSRLKDKNIDLFSEIRDVLEDCKERIDVYKMHMKQHINDRANVKDVGSLVGELKLAKNRTDRAMRIDLVRLYALNLLLFFLS